MKKRLLSIFSLLICFSIIFTSCNPKETKTSGKYSFTAGKGEELNIVAGSEIEVLEPIIEEYAKKNKKQININYIGSLDMMNLLKEKDFEYDAIWSASSLWINMGDDLKRVKHDKSTSLTPIVFGIKKSKAQELGFVDKEVSIKDITKAVKDGKLKFAMTSATQSNSGASAYLSFLTALSGKDVITKNDLTSSTLQEDLKVILSGVNRSSGSSNWLVDLYLNGNYDAMVNYETLILQANQKLESEGKEALYVVYPKEGVVLSDSPLAYVDKGNEKKEKAFKEFQDYILSDEAQNKIEKTGRRSVYNKVRDENVSIFKPEWGMDTKKILNSMKLPDKETIESALNLYQTVLRKPSLTYYVLDYSGSMNGNPIEELKKALSNVIIPEKAKQNMLQGTPNDITHVFAFNNNIDHFPEAKGNDNEMLALYDKINSKIATNGTHLNRTLLEVFNQIEKDKELLKTHNAMIVILSDGQATDSEEKPNVIKKYKEMNLDVPIFSITFGDSDDNLLKEFANLSNAKIFDGRKDLIKAFKSVKGYN